MIKPTVEQLIKTLGRLGHAVFVNGDLNLNLVGIRKDYQASNLFDDTFCLFAKAGGAWFIRHWPMTTDPGRFHLKNGLAKGTAILKEGQYRGAYKIGRHRGEYPALVQAKPVTVYRDANKDGVLDRNRTETGLFGINIHRANARTKSTLVDKWSAGCQVLADPRDFCELMNLARKSAQAWGESFTYTLINEADLDAAKKDEGSK